MSNQDIPYRQRALVLQGGGALGAYEAGVLKVLCKKLIEGTDNDQKGEPLFHIVAGTSIGAMNAAILVSNVVNRKKTWEEAVKELEDFWTNEKEGLSSTPDYSKWWRHAVIEQDKNAYNKVSASPEALRKYYSVKEYFKHGTPNVCSAPFLLGLDDKFGDQAENLWYHHTSRPLEDSIVRYSKDPDNKKLRIATSWDKRQPRLLVFSVDVAEGKTVMFDSYRKEAEDSENSLYESDGITIDHIMSSGTLPVFYDFREIGGRKFCDGGLLSNTPFRELLQIHQTYWMSKGKGIVPDLEVYIVNVRPSKQLGLAKDHDGVKDRVNDITFLDRNSHYDENVANTETDYMQLIDKLKGLVESCISEDKIGSFTSEFNNFLMTEAKSKSHTGKRRTYKDLLDGRFKLINVIRIEPTHYTNSISGKGSDFTSETIKGLIKKGTDDAIHALNP
jgi:NTE family protein